MKGDSYQLEVWKFRPVSYPHDAYAEHCLAHEGRNLTRGGRQHLDETYRTKTKVPSLALDPELGWPWPKDRRLFFFRTYPLGGSAPMNYGPATTPPKMRQKRVRLETARGRNRMAWMGTMAHKLPPPSLPSPQSIPSVPQSTRRIFWFPPPKDFCSMLLRTRLQPGFWFQGCYQDSGTSGGESVICRIGPSRRAQVGITDLDGSESSPRLPSLGGEFWFGAALEVFIEDADLCASNYS